MAAREYAVENKIASPLMRGGESSYDVLTGAGSFAGCYPRVQLFLTFGDYFLQSGIFLFLDVFLKLPCIDQPAN